MLFNKITVRNKLFKNRVIMLPTVTNFASVDGFATQKNIDYYKMRAKGPAAVICEASYAHPSGKCFPNQIGIDNDDKIEGLSKMVAAISKFSIPGIQIALNNKEKTINELSADEIKVLRYSFVAASARAQAAGFEMIELHFAHGWLINQFLSRASNKRTDEYGGSLENRMRLALEITDSVRENSKDMIISARINADDFTEHGFNLEEAIVFAKKLEDSGVDIISVSAGGGAKTHIHISPMSMPKAPLMELVYKIKQHINIPVLAANRLNDYELAADIIEQKKADFIGIARGFICDPSLADKWAKKQTDDVIPCISCNQACIANIQSKKELSCLMNPAVYVRPEFEYKQGNRKKVLIIGAGPAGLSCAKYLKLRGADVILCEKESEVGGQLRIAYVPPGKSEFKKTIDYYSLAVKKLNVDLRLNTEADAEYIKKLRPDVVVIAAGADPLIPDFAKDNKNVLTADEILKNKPVGGKIAVLGGGLVGLETAQFLARQGKKAAVFEMGKEILPDMPAVLKKVFLENFDVRVTIFKEHKVLNISENTLVLQNLKTNVRMEKQFDNIVLALGRKAKRFSTKNMNFCKVIEIGDYKQVRDAAAAIEEGYKAAMTI